MEATFQATITRISRKVSIRDNVYHEVDLLEHLKDEKGNEAVEPREWKKLFYANDIDTNLKEDLINKRTTLTMLFYPVKRQVGDKNYTNIQTHIKSIKGL